jgi:hypothetical protein
MRKTENGMDCVRGAKPICDISDGMVQTMKEAFGVDLDYSLESLGEVERLLTTLKPSGDRRHLAFGFGCYVGETLARSGGGHWVYDETLMDQMGSAWLVALPGHVITSPTMRCAKFMRNGTKDGIEVWGKCAVAMSRQPVTPPQDSHSL